MIPIRYNLPVVLLNRLAIHTNNRLVAQMALLDKTKFGYSASKMPFGIHYSWVIVAVLAIVQVFGSSVHDCRRNGAPADRP